MASYSSASRSRLILPPLGRLYGALQPLAEATLRFTAGACLVMHGIGKIGEPMKNVRMVENLGFYPGTLFSPLLAGTEFFGGILIAVGLLTRPAAAAALFVMLVTVYFHWIVQGQGFAGSEKSILWSAMLFLILVRGGGRFSLDAKLGREF